MRNYIISYEPLGVLTQSVFIPGTQLAITANTEGSDVIWEDLTPPQEGSPIEKIY